MGLFRSKVPDTIGKDRAEELKRRGARQSWTDKKAVDRRKATERQRKRSSWS